MRILAVETSCDETAIAILECSGDPSAGLGTSENATCTVLGNALLSQIDLHKQYGGVFPALAKREHAKNLVPILEAALEEAECVRKGKQMISDGLLAEVEAMLAREPGLTEAFFAFVSECEPPAIDAIAVTAGPGLEPALWVGINFAKALALVWQKPLVAVNHMEGHILAAIAQRTQGDTSPSRGVTLRKSETEKLEIKNVQFPILALLISGGHTQLVLMKKWLEYELVGETRDDAVGEAFDKVARMLALPYPGGPEISRLAEEVRQECQDIGSPTSDVGLPMSHTWAKLPRPMINENSCDFSFAGLKTAVLNLLKKVPDIRDEDKKHIAHEFENAVTDVLWKKTARALKETGAKTLVIGGGVSANTHIKRTFRENIAQEFGNIDLRIPKASLSTDNAIMIGLAGYYRALREEVVQPSDELKANGNLSLAKKP
ncbi:MAG: tRNA (adenosine(37)-N6)-threonylcarbamoyltransferase complex transferase subunit TsaD [Candidatus Paceibacterota bacterium]|jgi:N6-L-threonylcarbamoyladenine synthase